MIYSYRPVDRILFKENIGQYTAYGIALGDDILLEDVTCDKAFADEIIGKLNKFQASPIHICEIVENLIAAQDTD